MKIFRIIFYGLAALIVAYLLFWNIVVRCNLYGHGGNLKQFEKIQNGMSRAQVVDIMGEPSWNRRADDETTILIYGHSSKWCNLRIVLSSANTVISKQHVHNPTAPPEK